MHPNTRSGKIGQFFVKISYIFNAKILLTRNQFATKSFSTQIAQLFPATRRLGVASNVVGELAHRLPFIACYHDHGTCNRKK